MLSSFDVQLDDARQTSILADFVERRDIDPLNPTTRTSGLERGQASDVTLEYSKLERTLTVREGFASYLDPRKRIEIEVCLKVLACCARRLKRNHSTTRSDLAGRCQREQPDIGPRVDKGVVRLEKTANQADIRIVDSITKQQKAEGGIERRPDFRASAVIGYDWDPKSFDPPAYQALGDTDRSPKWMSPPRSLTKLGEH